MWTSAAPSKILASKMGAVVEGSPHEYKQFRRSTWSTGVAVLQMTKMVGKTYFHV